MLTARGDESGSSAQRAPQPIDGKYTLAADPGNIILKAGILPGDMPESHEWKTLNRLAAFGLDVFFVVHPDVVWDALEWDMKHPYGSGKNNMKHAFDSGQGQARRLIIDLSRSPFPDTEWVAFAENRLRNSKNFDEFLLILKDGTGIRIAKQDGQMRAAKQ